MTDERVIRMAQEHAALVVAVRRYVARNDHQQGGCNPDPCELCAALARVDRREPQTVNDAGTCT